MQCVGPGAIGFKCYVGPGAITFVVKSFEVFNFCDTSNLSDNFAHFCKIVTL